MVAFKTQPPKRSQYGDRSVPPPANPRRSGARARTSRGVLRVERAVIAEGRSVAVVGFQRLAVALILIQMHSQLGRDRRIRRRKTPARIDLAHRPLAQDDLDAALPD